MSKFYPWADASHAIPAGPFIFIYPYTYNKTEYKTECVFVCAVPAYGREILGADHRETWWSLRVWLPDCYGGIWHLAVSVETQTESQFLREAASPAASLLCIADTFLA